MIHDQISVTGCSMNQSYYRYHVFFCTNQRQDGSQCCQNRNARAMRDYVKQRVKALGMGRAGGTTHQHRRLHGPLLRGPVLVVYPEAVWYTYVDREDIDEIVEEHLVHGRVVERLRIECPSVPEAMGLTKSYQRALGSWGRPSWVMGRPAIFCCGIWPNRRCRASSTAPSTWGSGNGTEPSLRAPAMPPQALVFRLCPTGQTLVEIAKRRVKRRWVVTTVVRQPTPDDGIEHPSQVVNPLVHPATGCQSRIA